ncbi:MAG: hypothetical protein HKP59_11930 [Lutibacter sp.]|uniref:hypothetical protein n=1 Tax=Lutibacter sp. TaxID=1925666 RepID=UPI001840C222|nr:hypothetical protein [Lutibacter sp.]MBT8318323.1 hypothetical protein [Lutibacter sp.]NNJ59181.1 hypothetical protein [Lutibacter sp.]
MMDIENKISGNVDILKMNYKLLLILFFSVDVCLAQGNAKSTAHISARIINVSDTATIKMIEIEKSIKNSDKPKLVIEVGMTYADLMGLFNKPERIIEMPNHKKKLIYDDCFVYINEFEIVEIVRFKKNKLLDENSAISPKDLPLTTN